jgi:hypothetical protein
MHDVKILWLSWLSSSTACTFQGLLLTDGPLTLFNYKPMEVEVFTEKSGSRQVVVCLRPIYLQSVHSLLKRLEDNLVLEDQDRSFCFFVKRSLSACCSLACTGCAGL